MNLANLLKIALKALDNGKMRCFLTMLGVIIGVASVISMLAIGQGSKQSIKSQISEMGSNIIMIHPGTMERGGVRQSGEDRKTLKPVDCNSIKENAEFVSLVSPVVNSSGQFIKGENNYPSSVYGVAPSYMDIRRLSVEDGELFSDNDIRKAAKVCLIGKTVAENLFADGESPVGKVIRFNKIPLTVVGTLESKGYNSMGMDQDDIVLVPYTTVMKRIQSIDFIHEIVCSAKSEELTERAISELTELLRSNHKISANEDDDFTIRSQKELSEMMSSTSEMMTILLACVAGISLLVGGIGIMNIMYVSVTERTREIGLRMGIGARRKDILAQFLIEAVIISVTGGFLGVIFGVFTSIVIKFVFGWPVSVEMYSIVLSFAVCTITGIFFGWYPVSGEEGF